ncbi:MAG: hypothetical protein ACREGK_05845 [Geminicoccales bacterium]
MQIQSIRMVPRSQDLARIAGDRGRRRHFRQQATIWPAEPQLAVRFSIDPVALLVDGAVMSAALCRAPDYAEFGRDLEGEGDLEVGIIRS